MRRARHIKRHKLTLSIIERKQRRLLTTNYLKCPGDPKFAHTHCSRTSSSKMYELDMRLARAASRLFLMVI